MLQIEAKTQSQTWAFRGHEGKRSNQKLTDLSICAAWERQPSPIVKESTRPRDKDEAQVGINKKTQLVPNFALPKKRLGIHVESFFFQDETPKFLPFLRRSTS